MTEPTFAKQYDVVIIGGGAAGLSAATTLGRSLRNVLVIDDGAPRNAPADGVHNLLGSDGMPPRELVRVGRAEAEQYGVRFVSGRVAAVTPGFRIELVEGLRTRARCVIVATGVTDVLPDVPGLAEQWGRGVVHCPYCHGWEVRGKRIGVLLTSPTQLHQVHLFRQLSEHVTVFVGDPAAIDEEARTLLQARGIRIRSEAIASVESANGIVTGIRTASGEDVELDAIVVASVVEARIGFLNGVGLAAADLVVDGHRIGSQLPASPMGATSVPGLWAAGNVTQPMATVVASAAAGQMVGAQVNAELAMEDARAAAQP